ncbi:MAG: glutaredoxin family protein [Lysobacterales bacterium]
MNRILRTGLVWTCFLALGLGGGYALQQLRAPAAAAAQIVAVDRNTPGLPAGDQLVLVSLSTCPACAQARTWLGENGQSYVELAVDQSPEAKALAQRLGINAVPVLILGNRSIRGFDGDTFAREIRAWRAAAVPSA